MEEDREENEEVEDEEGREGEKRYELMYVYCCIVVGI